MRYAILGDIHGNSEALQAVLKLIKKQNIDTLLCIGDIVGYGADPGECVKLIRREKIISVAGNHDYAAAGLNDTDNFNSYAAAAVAWTKEKLSKTHLAFLAKLPLTKTIENFMLVHAGPKSPHTWGYIRDEQSAQINIKALKQNLCFIGHSHIPITIYGNNKECEYFFKTEFVLDSTHKYIINVGSVGQPRDNNPKACFAIYDTKVNSVRIIRIPYDIELTKKKILENGLPPTLAHRLSKGR
jgi:diadenosine tetraphosphatase ApaH/serine/threonine PP2A family protein phosphatase